MRSDWKLAIAAIALAAALTGCGQSGQSEPEAAAAEDASGAQTSEGTEQAGRPEGMTMGAFGKIKSIEGQTITIYKSSFNPEDRPQGGTPPQEAPDGGQAQGDAETPASGEAPDAAAGDGQQPAPEGEQSAPGGGGRSMEDMFADETVTIRATDGTKIVKRAFENGQMSETEIALNDLKADDVITYTLVDGTEDQAATIGVGTGAFGGGRGPGQAGQGEAPAPSEAPASEPSESNG